MSGDNWTTTEGGIIVPRRDPDKPRWPEHFTDDTTVDVNLGAYTTGNLRVYDGDELEAATSMAAHLAACSCNSWSVNVEGDETVTRCGKCREVLRRDPAPWAEGEMT